MRTRLTFRQLALPSRLWLLSFALLAACLPAAALAELNVSEASECESEIPVEEYEFADELPLLRQERREDVRLRAGRVKFRVRCSQAAGCRSLRPERSLSRGHRLSNGLCAPLLC
ncbi:hypothetical protein GC176_03440 [bacterium]|nr:hypothetical protein [bacterium]